LVGVAEENESGTIVGGLAVRPRCEPAMRIETRQDATMRCVFGWLYSWRPPVERTERKQNMTLQRGLPKSALGHKRTSAPQKVMSALPPKADMCGANEMPRAHPPSDHPSLDYRQSEQQHYPERTGISM